ncbi:phospholipase A1-like [Hermetia illucens]|uniref:phospholipase A1-like n=1 Tax=Hermetia illucens TaxID=343691 RepID=UPI0018CC4497|nr:phospholipase A1-like [Hermetia illucens]
MISPAYQLFLDQPALLNLRIICNGWLSGNDTDMNKVLRNAYAVGNFNVIIMDWTNAKLDVNNTYLIGQSLGAHIVGFAGKLIQTLKINTIFGLDPAGIPFNTAGPNDRLNIGDGSYVETINTDVGVLGSDMSIGNASFFPNYGTLQPGCIDPTTLCSHARANVYFGESIEASVDFYAAQCSAFNNIIFRDCNETGPVAYMGGEPSNYDRGVNSIYYLPINSDPP